MSFKKIERAVEFLERIGLTEIDIEIYSLLLDSPPLSIGEIQQSLGKIEFLEVGASIRDMQDIGLVRATKGDYHRYFAVLPFLRESVTVERETVFALNSLVTSIKEKKWEIDKKLEEVSAIALPNYTSDMVKQFTEKFHSPVASNLQVIKEATSDTSLKAFRIFESKKSDIHTILSTLDKDLPALLKDSEVDFSKFTTSEVKSITSLLEKQMSENTSALSKGHKEISTKLIALKSTLQSFEKQVEKNIEEIEQEISQLTTESSALREQEQKLTDGIASVDSMKQDLLSSLITTRETLTAKIVESPENPSLSKDDLKNGFNSLIEGIKRKESTPLQELLEQVSSFRESIDNSLLERKVKLNELKKEVKGILASSEESLTKIGKSVTDTLSGLHSDFVNGLEMIDKEIEARKGNVLTGSKKLQNQVEKSVESVKTAAIEEVGSFFEELSELVETTFKSPEELIAALEKTLEKVSEEQINSFVENNESIVKSLIGAISEAEDFSINLLYERINFAKTMLEGRGADLRAILKMSTSFDVKRPIDTGIVLGLPAIYSTLSDFVLRTKRMVTVVTPKFDEGIFNVAVSMRGKFRTTIVTKFNPKRREAIIQKAKDIGTISLIEYEGEDILACFRDKEEIVFGYIVKGEDWTAVRSSQDSMINLFEDRLNEVVIRRSKKLV